MDNIDWTPLISRHRKGIAKLRFGASVNLLFIYE